MGNRIDNVPQEDLENLQELTNLSYCQIKYLYHRFMQLTGGQRKYLIKTDFFKVQELHTNPLMVTMANCLFGKNKIINFQQFVMFLNLFNVSSQTENSDDDERRLQDKLKLLFSMYDANKDGRISKEELFHITHRMYSDQMEYYDISRIVEIMFYEAVGTESNEILFTDFCAFMSHLQVDSKLMIRFPE